MRFIGCDLVPRSAPRGYVVRIEDDLLPGIARAAIEAAFGSGASHEMASKMKAPRSSSARASNSFARRQRDPKSLIAAGLSRYFRTSAFEAKWPNGVCGIPPGRDVLLERGEAIVGVESKCTERFRFLDAYQLVKLPRSCPAHTPGGSIACSRRTVYRERRTARGT